MAEDMKPPESRPMSEVEELVKRLRARFISGHEQRGMFTFSTREPDALCREAADTIESLRASLTRVEEERDAIRLAWRQDAAARLGVYTSLRESGLIGPPEQVDVSMIMPTLAMLDQDSEGEYLDHCATCSAPLQWGAKIGIAAFSEDDTAPMCEACAGEMAVYIHDGIDIDREIARARDVLSRASPTETERSE